MTDSNQLTGLAYFAYGLPAHHVDGDLDGFR
jgi:hypothetical protein